jgi:uncharacterized protein (TIGR04222 family)
MSSGPSWGIPPTIFLLGFCAAMIGWVIAFVVTARRPVRDVQRRTLTPEHLGMIAGGPDQAVQTAVAALIERGDVMIDAGRTLVRRQARPTTPLESAVLADLMSVGKLRQGFASRPLSPPLAKLETDLSSAGLIISSRRIGLRNPMWYVGLLIWLVGLARMLHGQAVGRPTGNLVGLLTAGTVIAVAVALVLARRRTGAGRSVLRTVRKAGPPPSGPVRLDGGLLLMGAAGFTVAVWGPSMLPPAVLDTLGWRATGGLDGGGGGDGGGCGGGGCGGGCGG